MGTPYEEPEGLVEWGEPVWAECVEGEEGTILAEWNKLEKKRKTTIHIPWKALGDPRNNLIDKNVIMDYRWEMLLSPVYAKNMIGVDHSAVESQAKDWTMRKEFYPLILCSINPGKYLENISFCARGFQT